MIEIRVNGKDRECDEGTTVMDLLLSLGLDPQQVAVEHNVSILEKGEYSVRSLHHGDQVEIVHFVGGGCGRQLND
jgi:thiamine biosynthesis protein ThiS